LHPATQSGQAWWALFGKGGGLEGLKHGMAPGSAADDACRL